jgi:hypothetical protein
MSIEVSAYDADTGELLWHRDPAVRALHDLLEENW